MSAPPATRQPAPRSALRRLVARHPVAAFLIMVYTLTLRLRCRRFWHGATSCHSTGPYESLGSIFGVALPAFLVVAATHGKAGVLDLAHRSLKVARRRPLVPRCALRRARRGGVVHQRDLYGLAPLNALVEKWQLLFTEVLPQLLLLIVFFNLAEEVGCMGFLQARLQDRHGPLKASLIVTVPFALSICPAGWSNSD